MTLDQMYDEMSLYGFDDFEDEQKLTLLNEAYFDIVTREPWPFLEVIVPDISVPSGVERITNNTLVTNSPSDVNAVLSMVDTTNAITMVPERADVIEKNYKPLSDSGTARAYYFVGDELHVYPPTNGSVSYRLYYTRVPTAASTTSDTFLIPSRHHSIIVYGALVKAFLVNDDPQAAAFQNMFEQRYQQMRVDVWMNQYDRTDRIHVLTDSFDWNY
jgi:hypothetical protein